MSVSSPRRHATPLNPKQLLLSKWTAVTPRQRQKHFLVTRVIEPDTVGGAVEWVELMAVLTRRVRKLRWQELTDETAWRRGWL